MGQIPFDILWGCVGTNSLDRSSKELGYFASREVDMFALLSFVHGKGQIVRLLLVPGTDDHPDGTSDGTEVRKFLVRSKGDGLAILPILLDPPSDLDAAPDLMDSGQRSSMICFLVL